MNWYKIANQVTMKATLKKTKAGFYYLDIPNDFSSSFLSLIEDESKEKAPYDVKEFNNVGCHISVMSSDDLGEGTKVKEVGKEFSFKLNELKYLNPEGWDEMDRVWIMTVDSPELEQLRASYGLSRKNHGHEFHITVAVRSKK